MHVIDFVMKMTIMLHNNNILLYIEQMIKISDIIEEMVWNHPFLEDALHNGYLNLTAFSEFILPDVKKRTGKEVSVHAIKMALSRLERPKELSHYEYKFSLHEMTTRTGISIVSLPKTPEILQQITQLYQFSENKKNGYLSIIEGSSEIDIVLNDLNEELVNTVFPVQHRLLSLKWLALCSLHLSDKEIEQSWLLYSVTKQLAFHKINIVQIISTYHELGIIISEEDIKSAVTVLLP